MLKEICLVLLFIIVLVIFAVIIFKSTTVKQFSGGDDIVEDYDISRIHTKITRLKETSPTVIFIAGLGNSLDWWNWNEAPEELIQKTKWPRNSGIQDPISKIANTLSFDMPGVGKSIIDSVDKIYPTSFQSIVNMIDKLAAYHKMPLPYILVGHSIGGMIARAYQNEFPEKVAGMILIDPSPDFIIKNLASHIEPTNELRKLVTFNYMKSYQNSFYALSKKLIDNPSEKSDTIVHYNTDPTRNDSVQQEEYIKNQFKNTIQYFDKTHWIHIQEPVSIIKSITDIVQTKTGGDDINIIDFDPKKHISGVKDLDEKTFVEVFANGNFTDYSKYCGWVLIDGDKVRGFCLYDKNEPYGIKEFGNAWNFADFAVAKEYSGRGYGRKMLQKLIDTADDANVVLTARAYKGQKYLIKLYSEFGFNLIPKSENNIGSPKMVRIAQNKEPYLNEVISYIRDFSLVRDDPHVVSIMKTGKTIKEVVDVLRDVDGHSSYTDNSIEQNMPVNDSPPTYYIKDSVGYLTIPYLYNSDTDSLHSIEFSNKITEALDSFNNIKKIVINLENNQGGNIHPMRKGLLPLLSTGSFSGDVGVDNVIYWNNANGTRTKEFQSNDNIQTKFANVPIEVKVGPNTKSSGEILAIDLLSNQNVTITGSPTHGMCSSNDVIMLRGGGTLNLKCALIVNPRTKEIIKEEKIYPEIINNIWDHLTILQDLGRGAYGDVYVAKYLNRIYALKREKILPKNVIKHGKIYSTKPTNELKFFNFIDTLPQDEQKYFVRLHAHRVIPCTHQHKWPEHLQKMLEGNPELQKHRNKLEKSPYCVEYLMDFGGNSLKSLTDEMTKNNLINYPLMKAVTHDLLNIIKITRKHGYVIDDLHSGNITIINVSNDNVAKLIDYSEIKNIKTEKYMQGNYDANRDLLSLIDILLNRRYLYNNYLSKLDNMPALIDRISYIHKTPGAWDRIATCIKSIDTSKQVSETLDKINNGMLQTTNKTLIKEIDQRLGPYVDIISTLLYPTMDNEYWNLVALKSAKKISIPEIPFLLPQEDLMVLLFSITLRFN
jgi:pimeloyl-ACP methyl ester carboxylesterase/GNAT superfamily N-acetyltransferase